MFKYSFEECLKSRGTFELASSAAAKSAYIGDKIALCHVANRFKMYVPTYDLSLAPHLLLEGYWESWISVAFSRLLKLSNPSEIINIGANLGYYSLLGAALSPTTKVLAYEPQQELVKLIQRSAMANGFNNIVAIPKALGSSPGSVWLRRFDDLYGSAMITPENPTVGATAVSVNMGTLDLEDKTALEFFVIDAEGFEFEILKGAQSRLKDSSKVIGMLEFSGPRYENKHDFVEWLADQGFDLYKVAYNSKLEQLSYDYLHSINEVIDLVITKGYLPSLIQEQDQ